MSVKPLKPITHLMFWGTACIVFVLMIILFKDVLLPFVLGIAVAYLLNPVVSTLGKYGLSRAPAAMLILGTFLLVILVFVGTVSPIVYRELVQLAQDLPQYIEKFWNLMTPVTALVEQYIGGANGDTLQNILKQNSSSAVTAANFIVTKIAQGGQAILDVLSVALFMPVVAYFMMKEWPSILEWVRGLMPRHSEGTIMDLLRKIDHKLSGFVRGQISVSVILGLGYAVALSVAGLKYGFLIGFGSGVLSIIPMVGSAVGLVAGVTVAWFQTGDWTFVGIVVGIFALGQFIEGNFLTPKLVGDSVGLHPLWIFFALLAGGSLLGLLGMFLAVPVAAVIGVLVSFTIQKYKESAYYRDPVLERAEHMKRTTENHK